VRLVTEDDVREGRYDIGDVVMPLPGNNVTLPENGSGGKYLDILVDLGLLPPDDGSGGGRWGGKTPSEVLKSVFTHDTRKQYSLGGDYRKIISRPTDFTRRVVRYDDPLEPIITTDLMEIQGLSKGKGDGGKGDGGDGDGGDGDGDGDGALTTPGDKIGLVVGFSLPSSSYATMMVRELTRRPTLPGYQNELRLEGRCEGRGRGREGEDREDQEDQENQENQK